MLDEYGLSRDDLMETMKDLQLIVAGDKEVRGEREGGRGILLSEFPNLFL